MQCGSERYEDFMQLQYQKDKHETDRQRYADEIKVIRKEHLKEVEAARKTYKREAKADDTAGEKAHELEVKAMKAELEKIRRQYVEERDHMRRTKCHALQIPELKEYDLENY